MDNFNNNNDTNDQNVVNETNTIKDRSEEPTGELRVSPEAMDEQINIQPNDMFPEMNAQPNDMFPGMNAQPNDMFPGMNAQPNDMFPGMNAQPNGMFPGMSPMSNDFPQGSNPPKVKKPMTKGKIAGIVTGAVALIALIVCGVIFLPSIFKPAKDVVVDAFENTFEAKASASAEDATDVMNTFNDKGGQFDMKVSIKDSTVDEFEGLAINLNEQYDPVNKLFNMTIQGNYKEASLIVLDLIGTQDTTYVQIKDMINGYFSTPNDLAKLYENELFSQDMGVATGMNSSMVIDYFPEEEVAEINSSYVDAIENLWDSVSVEKNGSAKISVNGKDVKAKEYVITLTEENIEESLASAVDGIANEIIANPDTLAQTGMDAEQFKTAMDQAKAFIPSIVSNDFVAKVYIKNKKVVKVISSDDISLYGVQINYDFELDMDDDAISSLAELEVMGEKVGIKFNVADLKNKPSGVFSIYAPETAIDFTFTTTENSDKKKAVNAQLKYNSESLCTVDFTEETKDDNSFSGVININVPETGVLGFTYEGKHESDKSKYKDTFDSIKIMVDGETELELAMEYSIDTSAVNAKNIDTSLPVYDLSTITESEFENLLLDNQDNIMNWVESLITNAQPLVELFGDVAADFNDISEPEPNEPEGTQNEVEDDILVLGDSKVKILGSLEGYTKDYTCEYFVDYSNENGSYIEYMIDNKTFAEKYVEDIYIPDDGTEIYTQNKNQTIEVDGTLYLYSMVEYDFYGDKVASYRILKQIGEDLCIITDMFIYGEEVTIEDLVKALTDDKYEIISE